MMKQIHRNFNKTTVMNKNLFLLSFLSVVLSLVSASCTKQQTELSGDNLPQKITVLGHARYVPLDKNLAPETPEIVSAGTGVNVFYGIPNADGKVEAYACKSIVTDATGKFKTEIGCPVGQTLEVKVESSCRADSYAKPDKGSNVVVDTYFYGTVTRQVPCGKTQYFDLLMSPSAYDGDEGLVQPK